MAIILLIFMSDVFFLYMSNEGCFTLIYYPPFCTIYGLNNMNILNERT